jgi:hypothetical protein
MTRTDITTGLQTVTAAGAVTGVLDTAALSGDYTIRIRVTSLEAGKTAIIAVQDTANASAFSDAITVAVFHVQGLVDPDSEIELPPLRKFAIPGTRFGAANTKLRLNVLSLTSSSNLRVQGWLEQ